MENNDKSMQEEEIIKFNRLAYIGGAAATFQLLVQLIGKDVTWVYVISIILLVTTCLGFLYIATFYERTLLNKRESVDREFLKQSNTIFSYTGLLGAFFVFFGGIIEDPSKIVIDFYSCRFLVAIILLAVCIFLLWRMSSRLKHKMLGK